MTVAVGLGGGPGGRIRAMGRFPQFGVLPWPRSPPMVAFAKGMVVIMIYFNEEEKSIKKPY